MSFAPDTETLAKPEAMLRVPVGLASPLWGLFAGAAMTGATWWWMTRWARPENLEAMVGAAPKLEAAVAPEPATFAEPVFEAAQAVVEAAVEAAEAAIEVAPEPVAEALIEAVEAPEAVGGEAAPISPVLEAMAPETAFETAIETAEPVEPVVVAGGAADVALEPVAEAKPKKKTPALKAD
jgi:hypothetical protein